MYKKTVYTACCNGKLQPGMFGNKEVYICQDCSAIFSRWYIEKPRYKVHLIGRVLNNKNIKNKHVV